MSSSPNVCIVAEITPPIDVEEFLQNLVVDGEVKISDDWYVLITSDTDESGLSVNECNFGTHEFLTRGWGDCIDLDILNEKAALFEKLVKDFCDKNNCTYSLKIQANWW